MPPKVLDCSGYMACVRHPDGTWHPVDWSPVLELVEKEVPFTPLKQFEVHIDLSRKEAKRIIKYLWGQSNAERRMIRRQKRQKEKMRRKRLKEANHAVQR